MNNLLSKQDLTTHDLQLLASEMDKKQKSTTVTWLMWLFLGGVGGHRYYLGKIGTGFLMTVTLGAIGIWTLIDAFLLNGMIRQKNEEIELKIIQDIKLMNRTLALNAINCHNW